MTPARLIACTLCLVCVASTCRSAPVFWTEMSEWAPPPAGDFPTAADLDGDNLPDLMVAGPWHAFRNDGACAGPAWSAADEWMVGVPSLVFAHPELCDLDRDGDPDLLIGEWYGELLFYRNVGTGLSPVWERDDAYFHDDRSAKRAPGAADLDGDGDLDIICGDTSTVDLLVFWNDGTPASPVWRADAAHFSAVPLAGASIDPNFADLDGDGDLDLVAAPEYEVMQVYEHTGSAWVRNDDLLTGVECPEFPSAALMDMDCDGRADLIVSGLFEDGSWEIRCYRNDGQGAGVEDGLSWGFIKSLFK